MGLGGHLGGGFHNLKVRGLNPLTTAKKNQIRRKGALVNASFHFCQVAWKYYEQSTGLCIDAAGRN